MLEIKPCLEKSEILPYCKMLKKVYSEGYYLYRATDGTEVLAVMLFLVGGNYVEIIHHEGPPAADVYLFDALLRAGLNYAAKSGIPQGHIPEEFRQANSNFFKKLNLPPENTFDIQNFFQKYKNCKAI